MGLLTPLASSGFRKHECVQEQRALRGSRQAEQDTWGKPSRGAAPSWNIASHGGLPSPVGPGKREGGAPALSLSFLTRLPLSLPLSPSQSAGPGYVSRSRSERCLGQQNRDCTGQARSGGRGLDRQGSGALGEQSEHLILPHCTLCQPPFDLA